MNAETAASRRLLMLSVNNPCARLIAPDEVPDVLLDWAEDAMAHDEIDRAHFLLDTLERVL